MKAGAIKLVVVGYTTYRSNPVGGHKSYFVYAAESGSGDRYYTKIHGLWYYARPAPNSGFDVLKNKLVPRSVIARFRF